MHAVSRAGDLAGRDVLVNGAGPIGSLVVAAAKYAGARTVIAADINDCALQIARAMGADEVRNVSGGGSLPEDMELVFEASGIPAVLGGVLRATARGGTLVQVGNLPGAPAPAALGDLVTREITWIGSYRFVDEISDALKAMAEAWTFPRSSPTSSASTRRPKPCACSATLPPAAARSCSASADPPSPTESQQMSF